MSWALRGLHRDLRPFAEEAVQLARAVGIPVTVTSTYRSWADQARLRDRYERGLSQFPANRPGDSAHNYRLAFDATVPERDRADWRLIRELIGWHVPGNDWIHAELPGWRQYVK